MEDRENQTMEETGRRVADSFTSQTYLLMPAHINGFGNLFGGQLLMWIDMLAGAVALRHTDRKVVTVAIDHLEFLRTAHVSDVVTLEGRVTWTGRTSMEVRIDSYKENKGGKRSLINTAYLVMVAVDDETEKPIPVPKLIIETEEEQREWEAAVKRAENRKIRRKEQF